MDEDIVDELLCDRCPHGGEACKDVKGEAFVLCGARDALDARA